MAAIFKSRRMATGRDRTFYVTITDSDIESLKSLQTLFDKYLDNMLVKFEQNRMIWERYKILSVLEKMVTTFEKVLTPFLKRFL